GGGARRVCAAEREKGTAFCSKWTDARSFWYSPLVASTPNGGPVSTTIPGPLEATPPPSLQRGAKTAKLLEVIGGARKVVILPHDNPDPDSLASAAALRNLIQHKLKGRTVVIGAGGIVARAENRALLSHLDV